MAVSIDYGNLATYLECSICLDKYDNPKQLACRHQYCKACLDEILVFNRDGSAYVKCPNKCAEATVIGENQTTNDLGTSYEFRGILDAFKPNERRLEFPKSMCNYTKGCQKDVAVYCCGNVMCTSCFISHERTQGNHVANTSVFFDAKEKELHVLCQEHLTKCTHLCCDDNFRCIYCLQRSHKDHVGHTIDNLVAKIRETLVYESTKAESISEMLKITKESILTSKKELEQVLRERKVSCLLNYLDFLNKEEGVIKEQFQDISSDHKKQYVASNPPKYYQNILLKSDVELAIERNELSYTSADSTSSLLSACVSLSDNFGIKSEHPLGELHVEFGEEILVSNAPVATFKGNFSQINGYDNIAIKLSEEMREFIQKDHSRFDNLNRSLVAEKQQLERKESEYKEIISSLRSKLTKLENDEVIMKQIKKLEKGKVSQCIKRLKKRGIEYIKELIVAKENEKLKALMSERPDIIKMRDEDGKTPFLYAASKDNVEVMKSALKWGETHNTKDTSHSNTALHLATWKNSVECVEWLLQNHPILLSAENKQGNTPLHLAASNGNLCTLKTLLNYGALIHLKNNNGNTPLQLAREERREQCVKELQRWSREHGETSVVNIPIADIYNTYI